MGFRVLLLLICISFHYSIMVSAEVPLTAAFIRDHQLWIKNGDQEVQLTKGQYVLSPKWSYDGRFIAYIDGDEQGVKSNLYIYDLNEKESYQPYVTIETSDFKWSPVKNQLAYNSRGILNVTKEKNGRPHGFENVSLGVSDFEWFPNGKEFIVSSQSNLLPTGWGPVPLFRIPVDANLNTEKMKPFYTIQTNESDLFAISADYFKWSFDGKWVSFLAMPTASWSNDSNTLCVLSSTGDQFQAVGKMLWYKDWIKWSASANQLAYISGEGRFFVENKKTKIADMPSSLQQKEYTPKGFVDLDLEWLSADKVIVARAKENKEWNEGPVPTMLTALHAINIRTEEQQQITFPKENELDVDPQVVGSHITWFRKKGKELKGDIWIKNVINNEEQIWLKNVDYAPVFFIQK
ncbi:translocation protein TolB [Neobacillus sp. 179-C4.2 HS]|uniref:Translocation protein TolB n=1 Tax=Neobacillus driksii TaxID=3035913 RepID=A0ABV4YR14_9BACI|nr:translocation protein TolB [Neobacillus sp. 179.-C4.2 HS]MDP5194866.1 translocation protein TolB [Neobacillus sp. 179.-C4.2 HS]